MTILIWWNWFLMYKIQSSAYSKFKYNVENQWWTGLFFFFPPHAWFDLNAVVCCQYFANANSFLNLKAVLCINAGIKESCLRMSTQLTVDCLAFNNSNVASVGHKRRHYASVWFEVVVGDYLPYPSNYSTIRPCDSAQKLKSKSEEKRLWD